MRAAAVKCGTAAVDAGYAMVAGWKSDLVGSDQLGGGLTLTGQTPSDDAKSGLSCARRRLVAKSHA
jgi:hypothetical protein